MPPGGGSRDLRGRVRRRRRSHHDHRGRHRHHGAGGTDDRRRTPSGDPLIIGAAVGLTGDAASGDVPLSDAMEYAVEELNKAGGIAGHPVKLIVKDTKSDPALGATVANELLEEGAQIMVGPAFPGMAVGVIQAAATKNVAVLGGVSTQPEYVKVGGAKAYLVAFGDNVQAAAVAEYALKQGYKTVYTLLPPTSPTQPSSPCSSMTSSPRAGAKRSAPTPSASGSRTSPPR